MSAIKLIRVLTGTAVIAGTVLALKKLGDKLEEMEKQARQDAQDKFNETQGVPVSTKEESTEKEEHEKIQSKIVDIKEAQAIAKAKKGSENTKLDEKAVKKPATKKPVKAKPQKTGDKTVAEKEPAKKTVRKPSAKKAETEKTENN